MRMRTLALVAASALTAGTAFAQQPSPRANPSVAVVGQEVSVEYGRPSLDNRPLAELLKNLPGDRMWRAGSEQVTTLETAGDIMIGDAKVAAGKYSLYIHCGEDGSYSLAVNPVLGQPLGKVWAAAPDNLKNEPWPHVDYATEIGDQEVARVPLEKATLDTLQDQFTIALDAEAEGAALTISWGDQSWSTSITPVS
jgi:hypothetical protein